MRKHTLLVAVPAFLVGCLVSAAYASMARVKDPERYRTAYTDRDLNEFAAKGYAVQSSQSTPTGVQYLMDRH